MPHPNLTPRNEAFLKSLFNTRNEEYNIGNCRDVASIILYNRYYTIYDNTVVRLVRHGDEGQFLLTMRHINDNFVISERLLGFDVPDMISLGLELREFFRELFAAPPRKRLFMV